MHVCDAAKLLKNYRVKGERERARIDRTIKSAEQNALCYEASLALWKCVAFLKILTKSWNSNDDMEIRFLVELRFNVEPKGKYSASQGILHCDKIFGNSALSSNRRQCWHL